MKDNELDSLGFDTEDILDNLDALIAKYSHKAEETENEEADVKVTPVTLEETAEEIPVAPAEEETAEEAVNDSASELEDLVDSTVIIDEAEFEEEDSYEEDSEIEFVDFSSFSGSEEEEKAEEPDDFDEFDEFDDIPDDIVVKGGNKQEEKKPVEEESAFAKMLREENDAPSKPEKPKKAPKAPKPEKPKKEKVQKAEPEKEEKEGSVKAEPKKKNNALMSVLIGVAAIILIWAAMFATDMVLINQWKTPLFYFSTETYEDGSKDYVGPLYKTQYRVVDNGVRRKVVPWGSKGLDK